MARTRIKICCIASAEEATLAAAAGVDALGLVGKMPTGPGIVTDRTARAVAATVPPPVMPWLLTSETEPDAILAHARACAISTVQIVSHIAPEAHDYLARHAPALRRVQVIHVEGPEALETIARYGERPHGFLLDSGRPSVNELGGTGRAHDWQVSARCVRDAPRPVFLAGGLTPQNVGAAVNEVRPFGVDVCSGLRDDTGLDPARLAAFVTAVGEADRLL
ncbi:MAG: phosphoribosylanthranilate isomerase [Acuticoccus sp.]